MSGVALGGAAISAYGGKRQQNAASKQASLARAERAAQNKITWLNFHQ